MRLFKHAPRKTAAMAAVCALALVTTSTGAVAKQPDPSKSSRDFRKAVTVRGVAQHLDALQTVANANGGTRASGTPGYTASRNYVVQKLRAAGYRPTVQTFDFPFFKENTPAVMERVSPAPKTYASPADFSTMTFSGTGDVNAAVVPVATNLTPVEPAPGIDSTSGCEAADFATFPDGAIALMQRGTCPFGVKAANAEAAGAAAAVIFNRGSAGYTDSIAGTLGAPVGIPAVGTSFAVGVELGAAGTTLHLATDTLNEVRTTYNVLAETARGNQDNVVMAGAHLDSVEEGPGINDNGSGSATILEIAEQLAKVKKKPANKVRFAWWGAEELNLLGSAHYVGDLVDNNPDALGDIALYLNFDMVGSPNFVRFVYDGDNSTGGGSEGPEGSAEIETIFSSYFASQGLASAETPFNGRSDYGPFIANGVPAGGLFTGAEGIKTAEQAATYGGTAGVAYDVCYHQACDTRANISMRGLDQMSDAAAHAIYVLARSTNAVNGQATGHKAISGQAKLTGPGQVPLEGHRAMR